ncbi:hypothetical protein SAMN05444161_8980 [Rhizobiales bacterium GAS191]|nr:hypothetical protein SAMN05444161_8980 [Rhizobiales bacterium GAS191]
MARPIVDRRSNPIIPTKAELGGLLALIAFYVVFDVVSEEGYYIVNVLGPSILFVIVGSAAWFLIKRDPPMIWAPLFSFRVATAAFFGIGSIVPLFLNETSRAYLESFYLFSDREIAKLNLIVACSVFVVLAACRLVYVFLPPTGRVVAQSSIKDHGYSNRRTRNYGAFYLITGGLIKYIVIVPVAIGWVTIVLPGAVTSLAALSLCGIYLLTAWSLSMAPKMFVWVSLFVALEMCSGLIMFNKTEALLPLITYSMGLLVSKISVIRIISVCCVIGLALNVMQPLVSFSRNELIRRQGDFFGGSLMERSEILRSYFDKTVSSGVDDEGQGGWMRITYVNAGTFAIALYDRGFAGDSFRNMFAVFFPRIFWPDKPINQTASEFAAMSYGQYGSNLVTPTLFAEAYWNFGWPGIPMIAIPLGIILALLSANTVRLLNRRAWLYMPVLFTSMQFGLSIDGVFVPTVVGGTVIIVGMQLSTAVVEGLMRSFGIDVSPQISPARQPNLPLKAFGLHDEPV